MIIFTLRNYIYILINNICLKKLIFLFDVNAHMLKKLVHEAILLTFSGMEPVYFVFIKLNLHLLQIRKVAGWSFLQNS